MISHVECMNKRETNDDYSSEKRAEREGGSETQTHAMQGSITERGRGERQCSFALPLLMDSTGSEPTRNGTQSPEIDVDTHHSGASSPDPVVTQEAVEDLLQTQASVAKLMEALQNQNAASSSPTQTQRFRTVSNTSEGSDAILPTLSAWDWVTIDGLKLPAVTRNKERYVAVHMVQLKLLSKFPPDIPPAIAQKHTMGSHKMTLAEAWTFNSINAIIRKFDLGCQLFTADDELVKLNDVQMFYWNVKLFNLRRLNGQYEESIKKAENNIQLLATATQLKNQIERDIQAVDSELERQERAYNSALQEDSTTANQLIFSKT